MLDPQSLDRRLDLRADVGHDSGERRVGLAERCARPKTLRARSRARGARCSVFLMFEMFCPSGRAECSRKAKAPGNTWLMLECIDLAVERVQRIPG